MTTLALLLVLSACAPLALFYKPGVSVAQLEADTLDCEVAALRDAPVASQTRRGAPIWFPGERVCNAAGNCLTRPGYWVPGPVYTVDVNEGLRNRLVTRCMAEKGYAPASIPPCPAGVAEAAPPAVTTTLPPLTQNSCVIRNRGGTWQIVNRG